MARKIVLALLCTGTLFFAVIIGYQFYTFGFDINSVDRRLFLAFISCIIGIARMFSAQPRRALSLSEIETAYKDILNGLFRSDRAVRKKMLRAIALYNQDKYKKALKSLNILLEKCETNSEASAVLFFAALCHAEQGHHSLAIERYENAVRLNPSNDKALSNLGLNYQKTGRFQDAIDCYSKAIAVNSRNPFAYSNMAVAYLDLMDTGNAIFYATEALKIKPDMHQAMDALALAYSLIGDKDLSEKYYQQSVLNGCKDADLLRTRMNQLAMNLK